VSNRDAGSDNTTDVMAISMMMPLSPESGTNAIGRLPSHVMAGLSTSLMTAEASHALRVD